MLADLAMVSSRVLVTGSSGFLGRSLVARLLQAGLSVTATYRQNAEMLSKDESNGLTLIRVDLTNTGEIRLLDGHDVIVHCAAIMRGDWQQYWLSNVVATRNLLEHAARTGCKRFIFISSGAVYGYAAASSDELLSPLRPNTWYGHSKLHGELLCKGYAALSGLQACSLRLYFPYGNEQTSGLLATMLNSYRTGQAMHLHSDGGPYLSMCAVESAADAVLKLIAHEEFPSHDAYNLCGDEVYSISSLIKIFEDISGRALVKKVIDASPGNLIGSNSLLKQTFGWLPEDKIHVTIEQLIRAQYGK